MKSVLLVALATVALLAQGIASRNVKPQPRPKFSGRPWTAVFTDISAQAGLTSKVVYGGEHNVDYLVETSSGGVAFLDYDGDGWGDIFLTTGARFGEQHDNATQRLYRNRRDGTFEDVTDRAGLRRGGWQSGVTVADVDADGHLDLLVTAWGSLTLWRNRGDGTFEDASRSSGLRAAGERWWSGATFLDYDRDGDLDLFVAVYVDKYDVARIPKPGANPNCNWKGVAVACGPRGLQTASPRLFRNDRGKFVDVSRRAGIAGSTCFGMTAAAADFSEDGWPDIYLACDSTPSLLFVNARDGTFREEGLERGVALNDDGREQAGMGLGIGDFNVDGRLDIFKTHFADDTHALYRGSARGEFVDVALTAGLAVETRYVGWGAVMADFDNDGWPDLFLATGNVYPNTDKDLPSYPYKSPPMLFRNLDGSRFEQIGPELAGAAFAAARSSRGAAAGDIDNDGDLDLLVWNRNDPPTLLRNDMPPKGTWLRVAAPLGTRVTASYGGRRQAQEVLSQSSFYSCNDPRLHFGLGAATSVDLEVRWPDGTLERRTGLRPGTEIRLTRSKDRLSGSHPARP
jgi:enediyne biosynthesis protein E4